MSYDKEIGEVVNAKISLVNNQDSLLVELLRAQTVMFARNRFVEKRLLLLMSSDSKMHYGKKGGRCLLPRFWVRPHRDLK